MLYCLNVVVMDTQNRTESAIEVSHIPDAAKQFFEALIIRLVKLVTDTSEQQMVYPHEAFVVSEELLVRFSDPSFQPFKPRVSS